MTFRIARATYVGISVRQATLETCIEEQDLQRTAAACVAIHMQNQHWANATADQLIAADHYQQAWLRLSRLIGVS